MSYNSKIDLLDNSNNQRGQNEESQRNILSINNSSNEDFNDYLFLMQDEEIPKENEEYKVIGYIPKDISSKFNVNDENLIKQYIQNNLNDFLNKENDIQKKEEQNFIGEPKLPSLDNENGKLQEIQKNKGGSTKFICKKRKNQAKEKKEKPPGYPIEKIAKKKENRSLSIPIKYFHTFLNYNITGKMKLESELLKNFLKGIKMGSNYLYINKNFTQNNISNEAQHEKLKKKLREFIVSNKKDKLNNQSILLDKTMLELIQDLYEWLYGHLDLLKKNEYFIKMNNHFDSVVKYPLVNLEYEEGNGKKVFGYLKYYGF